LSQISVAGAGRAAQLPPSQADPAGQEASSAQVIGAGGAVQVPAVQRSPATHSASLAQAPLADAQHTPSRQTAVAGQSASAAQVS